MNKLDATKQINHYLSEGTVNKISEFGIEIKIDHSQKRIMYQGENLKLSLFENSGKWYYSYEYKRPDGGKARISTSIHSKEAAEKELIEKVKSL